MNSSFGWVDHGKFIARQVEYNQSKMLRLQMGYFRLNVEHFLGKLLQY